MDGQESQDKISTKVEVEIEDPALISERSVIPVHPATVGPCPACRRIVTQAFGDWPDHQFWFHLAPRAGLCFRHREGAKAA
jgi:hypothetical protein